MVLPHASLDNNQDVNEMSCSPLIVDRLVALTCRDPIIIEIEAIMHTRSAAHTALSQTRRVYDIFPQMWNDQSINLEIESTR